MSKSNQTLPVIIIGAGPVGLAAAAHALAKGLTPLVLESGPQVGHGIRRWGHVRMFSPWRFNVDTVASDLLRASGWTMPAADDYPTGDELVRQYLEPLAATAALAPHIRLNTRVVAVARQDRDKMKNAGRDDAPFVVRVNGGDGEAEIVASAVVDASGTTEKPGPLGASGLPAIGEPAAARHIFYGMPDILGKDRARYANRHVLVAGSGDSALNALLDLATLIETAPDTRVEWVIRRQALGQRFDGAKDQLEERGRLGTRVRALLESGRLTLTSGFHIDRVAVTPAGVVVQSGGRALAAVDEIIAATGFRPDWSILSEVRLDLDPSVESPRALAPLIDPNLHSCGTVPPHGAEELKQPDANLFVVGMKSYGRAPTFLMLTGYEQARSVVNAIAGDWEAARRVELVLPETGVCSTDRNGTSSGSCCGSAVSEPVAVSIGGLKTAKRVSPDVQPSDKACC